MPRSLLRGDYSLVMAVESSSRPNSWYRVLADRSTGSLSCDCPPWVFNRNQDASGNRFCPHTRMAEQLAGSTRPVTRRATRSHAIASPMLAVTQNQWPGLHGDWSIEERDANIGTKPYHFVLVRLAIGNGGVATGVVAFADTHHHSELEMYPGVAGWAGYAIAAEVARLGGFPLAGQPPEHFRIDRRPSTRQAPPRRTAPAVPDIGLTDILRIGDVIDQGDGLTPAVRAERTLRMFLGETLYNQVENHGFLDISSVRYASEHRVYRMRRDRNKQRERRIRVHLRGTYWRDFCIVRENSDAVPEADHFLTVFLGLLSDEDTTLSVVKTYNVFQPYSDGNERETIPAVWHPRITSATVG